MACASRLKFAQHAFVSVVSKRLPEQKTLNFPLNPASRLQRNSGAGYRGAALLPVATLLLSLLSGCKQQEHHAADVWAVVNGTEIKRDEVEKYYKSRVNP